MGACHRLSALWVVAVSTAGVLLLSELASLLVDVGAGGAEGTVLLPSAQALVLLQLGPLLSLAWRRRPWSLRVLERLGWG